MNDFLEGTSMDSSLVILGIKDGAPSDDDTSAKVLVTYDRIFGFGELFS